MDPIIGGALISGGMGLLGGLLQEQDKPFVPEIPSWLIDMIRGEIQGRRTSGLMPERGVFQANLRANLAEFQSQLPIGKEAFEADLASRGIRGAGGAPGALYRDVYAPIYRAGAQAIAGSELGYAQMYQSGRIAEEQTRMEQLGLLLRALSAGKVVRQNY